MVKKENEKNIEVQARRERPQPAETLLPLVDVWQDESEVTHLVAEMPGVANEDVRVEVDKGVLTISGKASWQEPPPEKYSPTYLGFTNGEFYRAFALSDEIDRDKIAANMCCGVLKLMLPKAEAAKTRRIEITAE
jgi:HSP20 family molecular chaperone IbpA